MPWFRFYLAVLIAATVAIVPFPTPRSLIDAPSTPSPRPTILGYDRAADFGDWGMQPTGCTTREAVMADAWDVDSCRTPYRQWAPSDTVPFTDPYTGAPLDPADVEVDHIFPLRAAWDMGAHAWPAEKRTAFANDPINLVVTSSKANQAKSDMLPSEWVPDNRRVRCAYGQRIAAIARGYDLPLPRADLRAIRRHCSGLQGLVSNVEMPVHSVE